MGFTNILCRDLPTPSTFLFTPALKFSTGLSLGGGHFSSSSFTLFLQSSALAPGSAPGSAPGFAPGSAPGFAPGSAPGSAPGFAPSAFGGSTFGGITILTEGFNFPFYLLKVFYRKHNLV